MKLLHPGQNPAGVIIQRRHHHRSSHLQGLHPVLARILAARGVTRTEECDYALSHLLHWRDLYRIEKAVDLLTRAIEQHHRLLIVADYDADGATACALLMRGLALFGARQIDYLVPDRFHLGYGLSPGVVELAAERGAELLITVDNGITSVDAVAAARAAGMQVLITDHHLPGEQLPDAEAIVNPNQPGCRFASKALAGVGVAFYLLVALRAVWREQQRFSDALPEPKLSSILDLVALGTVADVVPLDRNNRILVQAGLERIRRGVCAPGITALLELGHRDSARSVASDLGFVVGPKLNAAGRLDDMSVGIECLLARRLDQARPLARALHELNQQRRQIEQSMLEDAQDWLARQPVSVSAAACSVCLYQPDWHEGVVGILAARIRERVQRPVIAFASASDGSLKGSGRSISGLHLRDVLADIAALHSGLIQQFGGHAMAAGLRIQAGQLEQFRTVFEQQVAARVDEQMLRAEVLSDGALAAVDLTLDLARILRAAGPWGQAFPEPVFDGRFRVVSVRLLKERHIKLMLEPVEAGEGAAVIDGIAFNQAEQMPLDEGDVLHLVYRLDVNEFRGRESLQLLIEHIVPV